MTYAGLTIADKGALLDAITHDGEWIVRTPDNLVWSNSVKPVRYEKSGDWNQLNGRMHVIGGADTLTFIKSNDSEPVDSYAALAQIAEMESAEIEKCPRCDVKPLLYTINSVDESRVSVWERTCPICEHSEVAITWIGAIRKWNRWARREAKRIKQEERQ